MPDEMCDSPMEAEVPIASAGATLGRQPQPEANITSQCHMVQITKVANGFCLQIGCKTFIAKTWVEASTGLAEYWQNPHKAEKIYSSG